MTTMRRIAATLIFCACSPPVWAAIQPSKIVQLVSFDLDYSVWKATHIVLATEGEAIDGRFKVIESWKGDLLPGAELILPELAAYADEESRRVSWRGTRDLPQPYAPIVSGSQRVLFLIKAPGARDREGAPVWLPAGYAKDGGFKVSVAWIERGEVYAFQQFTSPGPHLLEHLGNKLELKARVAAFMAVQPGIDQAVREHDPILAAQAFRAFGKERFQRAADAALQSLGAMGKVALPTLRLLLRDSTLQNWHASVISALAAAGGAEAAPDLAAVVESELKFWSGCAPTLKEGWWWRADPADVRRGLYEEHDKLLTALWGLRTLRYAPCRDSVTKLRDLWLSHPSLRGVGEGQISQACDAVLQALDGERRNP